jgi:hypothetical protein
MVNKFVAQMSRLAWVAACVWMIAALGGCLYETTLDANGGGTMTVTLHGIKRQSFDVIKGKMASSAVTVTSADFSGDDDNGTVLVKLHCDDILKLSTAEFFKNVTLTRTAGQAGTTVLSAVIRNNTKAPELSDAALAKLGNEVRVATTFPGDIVETNGTVSGGRTVNWAWNMKQFFKTPDVMMTAAYKAPAAGSADSAAVPATPAAAAPAAGGVPAPAKSEK